MPDDLQITHAAELDEGGAHQVRALAGRAEQTDGFPALNDEARLHLGGARPGLTHLLALGNDQLLGYAQLDATADPVVAALVVDPDRRRAGVGRALLRGLVDLAGADLHIWAPHDTPAARALADRFGLRPARRLLIMDRLLDGTWAAAPPPAGIAIRDFVVGRDEDAWLGVNARAFAHHPEQGRMQRADLDQRLAEPWFDPAGLLLAERDGVVVGFHWTKQHGGGLGEVYVLGVDPDAGLRGLGRPLLIAGLDHLRSTGDDRVLLYVEGDNEPALRLYERSGFAIASTDVLYAAG